jgi:hypothetical protein
MIMARAAWLHRPLAPGLPAITMPSHSKGIITTCDNVRSGRSGRDHPPGDAWAAQGPNHRSRPAISHPCPADQDGDASDTCRS